MTRPRTATRESVQFSTSALAALHALHASMRPSPAREALARLLRRRANAKEKSG